MRPFNNPIAVHIINKLSTRDTLKWKHTTQRMCMCTQIQRCTCVYTRGGHYYTCCTDTSDWRFWSRTSLHTIKCGCSPPLHYNLVKRSSAFSALVKQSSSVSSENQVITGDVSERSSGQGLKKKRGDQILIPVVGVSTASILVTPLLYLHKLYRPSMHIFNGTLIDCGTRHNVHIPVVHCQSHTWHHGNEDEYLNQH